MLSSDELRCSLEKQFKIICFVDLADVRHKHSDIFLLLDSLYKEEYQPDERLIFYSSRLIDQEFLFHIQRALTTVDISNFFVLFCTTQDISDMLVNANNKYGNDQSVCHNNVYSLEPTLPFNEPGYYQYDTLCPMPFTTMRVEGNLTVRPCCELKSSLGNFKQGLANIFQSKQIQNIRNEMKQGKKPSQCDLCWNYESENKNTNSMRQFFLDKFKHQIDRGWLDDIKIRSLDAVPSTLCNFKCRICMPELSSSIAAEELKFAENQQQIDIIKTDVEQQTQLNFSTLLDAIELTPSIEYMHLLGGEPLIWPDLGNFLDRIAEYLPASKLNMAFNTNGSASPKDILEKLEQFNSTEILISIDNVGNRFEYERGGKWDKVYSNIKQLRDFNPDKISVKLNATVNIQNVLYLEDMEDLSKDLGIEIQYYCLYKPSMLSIDNITLAMQKEIIKKYHNHPNSQIQDICNRVKNSNIITNREFLNYMEMLDRRRNTVFKETHNQVYMLMDTING